MKTEGLSVRCVGMEGEGERTFAVLKRGRREEEEEET